MPGCPPVVFCAPNRLAGLVLTHAGNAQVCASGSRYAQVVAGVRSSPKIARVTQRARRRVHSTPVASTGNVAPSPELTVSPIEPQFQFRVRTGMGTRCVSVRRMLRTGVRERSQPKADSSSRRGQRTANHQRNNTPSTRLPRLKPNSRHPRTQDECP